MELIGISEGSLKMLYGVAVVVGLIHVVYGFRIFKVIMAIHGSILGGWAGLFVAEKVGSSGDLGHVSGLLIGGLVGLVVLVLLWKIGVFVLGAGFGVAACTAFFTATSDSKPEPVISVVSAALGGAVALLLSKLLTILSTSLLGGLAAMAGIGGVLGDYSAQPENGAKPYDNLVEFFQADPLYLYCGVGLAVVGVFVQMSRTARDRHYE